MTQNDTPPPASARFPEEPVDRLMKPLAHFLRIEAASGAVLLAATVGALVLANSPWAEAYFEIWRLPAGIQFGGFSLALSLQHVINDGLMTLFFFVVGLEIKRELALGELRTPRAAAFPIAAAIGGMLVPAAIFLALQWGEPGERGWGMVMATDIAFVVGCLAVLGERVPHNLRIFVLSLAIIDDIGAVLVIAIAYSSDLNLLALGMGAACIGAVVILRHSGVRSIPPYVAMGLLAWFAVHESGIHPTIVGVALGLLTPAKPWIGASTLQAFMRRLGGYMRGEDDDGSRVDALRSAAIAVRETLSPLERLESALHPWVSFLILPLFAFANAGVPITAAALEDPVVVSGIAGLALGKPIGIFAASWLAAQFGIAARPGDLRWPMIAAAGTLCGVGFTMALFISSLAYGDELHATASLGILAASLISAVVGVALLAANLRPREAAPPP